MIARNAEEAGKMRKLGSREAREALGLCYLFQPPLVRRARISVLRNKLCRMEQFLWPVIWGFHLEHVSFVAFKTQNSDGVDKQFLA